MAMSVFRSIKSIKLYISLSLFSSAS